jgi:hypothetical protein
MTAFTAISASWFTQCSVVIGRKFSASRYWDEVRKSEATIVQYIGEIPRYLLGVEKRDDDKVHKVR